VKRLGGACLFLLVIPAQAGIQFPYRLMVAIR